MKVPVVSRMDRRQQIAAGIIVGAGVLLVAGVWMVSRRAELVRRGGPTWLQSSQPPEYIPEPVTPADAWAASRPGTMSSCCIGRGAGRRVLRTYPATLMDESSSTVRPPGSVLYLTARGGVA